MTLSRFYRGAAIRIFSEYLVKINLTISFRITYRGSLVVGDIAVEALANNLKKS